MFTMKQLVTKQRFRCRILNFKYTALLSHIVFVINVMLILLYKVK